MSMSSLCRQERLLPPGLGTRLPLPPPESRGPGSWRQQPAGRGPRGWQPEVGEGGGRGCQVPVCSPETLLLSWEPAGCLAPAPLAPLPLPPPSRAPTWHRHGTGGSEGNNKQQCHLPAWGAEVSSGIPGFGWSPMVQRLGGCHGDPPGEDGATCQPGESSVLSSRWCPHE